VNCERQCGFIAGLALSAEKGKERKKKRERGGGERQKRGNHAFIVTGIEFSCALQRKNDKDRLRGLHAATRDNNIKFMNNINGGLMERLTGLTVKHDNM